MDTRHNVEKVLGLKHGDAKVIRNAGNLLDDGTLRSLVVAVHLLGVRAVAILGHTKCGMTLVGRGEFRIAKGIAATTSVPLHEVMRPDFQRWLGGFPDAEERQTKLRLAYAINEVIKRRRLTQAAAAAKMGVGQPKVSALANYRLDGFSVERLMTFLTALDQDVEIIVKSKPRSRATGRISVVAG